MKNTLKIVSSWPVLTLLILALLAAAPVWGPGIVNTRAGGDSPFLLWRTHQMAANLRAGVFPVRWMPDAAYGYGYPFFSYYAALPFYVAGLLTVAGLDILTAIKLTQTLGFILAAFAMYGWTRRHFAPVGAWLAAVVYTFASFHLVNVYTRGDSLSEFYAFVFFPLILWAIDHAVERRDARSTVALALAFGGLLVTHNLSALIFSPFVALYVLLRAVEMRASHSTLTTFARCALGLALGLALSAWCWAPYFFERDYGQLAEQTTGFFNYSNHFRGLDLVQPTLAFDYEVGKTTPFAMSSIQAALALAGVVALIVWTIRNRKFDALSVFTLAGLFVSTFMITPLSRPLWDHVPYLPIVQFPWRFLTVQAVFTALATARLVVRKADQPQVTSRGTHYAAIALGLSLAIAALINLHPTRLYIGPSDVTTERLQLYEMFTANIGTTIRYEYLPRGVVPRLYTSDALLEPGRPVSATVLEGNATATWSATSPTRQTWRVMAETSGATLAFPILWWPGWQATVDGKLAPIRPATSSGRIVLDVARGEHNVVLSLGRTPLRAVAENVSLVALIAVSVIWLYPILNRAATRTRGDGAPVAMLSGPGSLIRTMDRPAVLAFVLILLIATGEFVSRSVTLPGSNDETMDFVSQPYLHHNPGGIRLGQAMQLLDYDFSADELQAGQTLNVRASWLNTSDTQGVTVTLVSPAEHLVGFEGAPALAQSEMIVPSTAMTQAVTVSLLIPPETPRGLYLVKVQGKERSVYLRPVRVRNERPAGVSPVVAQFGDRIRLHRVRAEQTTPTQLAVTLDWSAAQPVEANYAISVRLSGVASIDTQPGYGFLPTSLWRPAELVTDRYTLDLPEGTPPGNDYQIEVILYDAATLAGIGRYIQPDVALTLYSRRPADSPALAHFGSGMALASLDAPATHLQGAPTLSLKAGWLATSDQSVDHIARWTIYDSKGTPVLTQTSDLATNAPASWWPAGAFVAGQVTLNVPVSLPAGTYRVGVAMLNRRTQAEEGSYIAPSPFEVVGHPRSFTIPLMTHRANVDFGQQIRLLGYDLKSSTDRQILVNLYWQASATPKSDYKVFVHLFDPADEKIVTQHDALPLEGRYPTSWWTTGEVVSETVALDLKGVRPGTYRLAVGLYDAGTITRLAAIAPNGERLEADRAVLPETITVPK